MFKCLVVLALKYFTLVNKRTFSEFDKKALYNINMYT